MIDGYIHCEGQRCSIIARDLNWYTFEIFPSKSMIRRIKQLDKVTDAIAIVNYETYTLRLSALLKVADKKKNNHYKLSLFDLDRPPLSMGPDERMVMKHEFKMLGFLHF